ncbi:hypothetical protein FGL91_15850 [Microbacterium sp. CBA3102]|uniref:hypothetical protein n=1 Tax=Microbacterium sp. CBA3102 TaxID=2603598 RepID=UPI0011BB2F1E|nr:hypothetical protein [Microbacterium sp. CBA3102]QEA29890.1 hypothetical protein FGL91_15850 [Microbacterium sp. CBA3102]
MSESPRLVLNRTSESRHVLHREDCPSIQHQVRGDVREEHAGGYEIFETYEDGLSLIGPARDVVQSHYEAVYVTVDELASVGRYRRCRMCSPDAPDGPPRELVYRKKAESLGAADIGRVTVDGAIERIEHSASGTVVTLSTGDARRLAAGETVSFPKKSRAES